MVSCFKLLGLYNDKFKIQSNVSRARRVSFFLIVPSMFRFVLRVLDREEYHYTRVGGGETPCNL